MENIEAFTVTEITSHIKNVLENTIQPMWIEGEISNFKHHSSGHMYFSLKDENCAINCVFFKQYNSYLRFTPENGMKVLSYGKVTVYEKRGQYQILVNQMKPLGTGELEIAFQQLKEKLEKEGLFSEKYKKEIPEFPSSIGIVTASTGAAIQDIRNVLTRRFPVEICLISTRVQGDRAADEIVEAISKFNELNNVEVLIVGRGGGSLEDLWPFNEEIVARAIFNSKIPVISAVGHEVDFTISDFVADLRAPTPSAAAELVVPDRKAVVERINNLEYTINSIFSRNIDEYKNSLSEITWRLKQNHPKYILQQYSQQLDELTYLLQNNISLIKDKRIALEKVKSQFYSSFEKLYKNESLRINDLTARLKKRIDRIYRTKHETFIQFVGKLEELNPLKILVRGYAVAKKEGKIISSVLNIKKDDKLNVILSDGKLDCLVEDINEE